MPKAGTVTLGVSGDSRDSSDVFAMVQARMKDAGVSLVTDDMVRALEARIDAFVAERALPQVFIVPGANPASAAIDLARSIVRRAERAVVALERVDRAPNAAVRVYLNRLSDLLFVLARRQAGEAEPVSR